MNELEVARLARSVAAQLTRSDIKTVVVFDIGGPDGQWLPFGSWLADQISGALASVGQQVKVIDRAQLAAALDAQHLGSQDLGLAIKGRISLSLGADGFIDGTFGPYEDNYIGISLVGRHVSDIKSGKRSQYAFLINSKISVDKEAAAHMSVPLESLWPSDGIFKAGDAGMTVPECEYCPPPQYSAPALWKQKQGTVVMRIVVSPEGRATQIKVVESVGEEIDAQSVKAVESYRFKAAVDPDGRRVAVYMVFALAFRVK